MKTPPPTLTTRELNRALLARQMLLTRENVTPSQAVERLVGLQAQVARPPFVGLWTRLEGFKRADLHDDLRGRRIVRATAMRATLHMMTADDFVGLRGALQPALTRGMLAVLRDRASALDLAALEATGREFFAATDRTFDDLRVLFRKTQPAGDERAMAYAIRTLVPLVQVPTEVAWGFPSSAAFTVADAWLGMAIPTDHAPADQLVRRYLASFGPATPGDAQAWSALAGLREAFERLRPELVTFRDARGRELFDLPDAPRPDGDEPAPVRFLPDFDNLILSHDDRTRVIADEHRPRVVTKNLLVRATFLVDGFVAGTWRIERAKKVATLIIEPFGPLAAEVVTALNQEGEALLEFAEEDAGTKEIRVAEA